MDARREVDGLQVGTLLALEARAHRWPDRVVRPLAGGLLVHDPEDPEPVFNRLVDPQAPENPGAWARWLAEIGQAFEALQRRPHVWLASEPGSPVVRRLEAAGFGQIGASRYLALGSPDEVARISSSPLSAGVELERVDRWTAGAGESAREVAAVIADAFNLDPAFRVLIEADVIRLLDVPTIGFVLARLDGEPVAAARRTTDGPATLLAAIGTRRAYRGQGFGRLVTAAAAADGLVLGSETVYLAVEDGNDAARHLYAGLGFLEAAGAAVAMLRR